METAVGMRHGAVELRLIRTKDARPLQHELAESMGTTVAELRKRRDEITQSDLTSLNTLVLSVFERTRELGMLRAVGMTRRQTRRMVRHESVITALIGAALGLPLGIFLAALVTRALQQFDVR